MLSVVVSLFCSGCMRCSDSVLKVPTWRRGICPQSRLVYVVTSDDGRTPYDVGDLLLVPVGSGIHVTKVCMCCNILAVVNLVKVVSTCPCSLWSGLTRCESVAFPASTMPVRDIVTEPVKLFTLSQPSEPTPKFTVNNSTIILSKSGYTLLSLDF